MRSVCHYGPICESGPQRNVLYILTVPQPWYLRGAVREQGLRGYPLTTQDPDGNKTPVTRSKLSKREIKSASSAPAVGHSSTPGRPRQGGRLLALRVVVLLKKTLLINAGMAVIAKILAS